jgi:hypothetical protein
MLILDWKTSNHFNAALLKVNINITYITNWPHGVLQENCVETLGLIYQFASGLEKLFNKN